MKGLVLINEAYTMMLSKCPNDIVYLWGTRVTPGTGIA